VNGIDAILRNNQGMAVEILSSNDGDSDGDAALSSVAESRLASGNLAYLSNGAVRGVKAVLEPMFLHQSILDVIVNNPTYSILGSLLKLPNVFDEVAVSQTTQGGTYLAPSDDVFLALTSEVMDELLDEANTIQLVAFLDSMFVAGVYPSIHLEVGSEIGESGLVVRTINDDSITLSEGRIRMIDMDLLAWNGIVHGIDQFLIPPEQLFLSSSPTRHPSLSAEGSAASVSTFSPVLATSRINVTTAPTASQSSGTMQICLPQVYGPFMIMTALIFIMRLH
jgi:uncharacterized surface protein with fasciclin (FAS1) repeats